MSSGARAVLWAGLPLLLLLPALLWLGQRFEDQLAGEQRARVQHILDLHAAALSRSMDRVVGKLESLEHFVAGQTAGGKAVGKEQFATLADGLHASAPWIRSFQIVTDGTITHVHPVKGNERTLGYNLLADPRPGFGEAVVRARETGRLTISGPVDLLQGGKGLVIRKMLPRREGSPALLVGVVVNIAPLLAELGFGDESSQEIRFAIRREGGEVFMGAPTLFERQPVTYELTLAEGSWRLGAVPAAGWHASLSTPVLLFHLTGGIILFLVCLQVFILARRESHLVEIVRERTDALKTEWAARQQEQEQFGLIMDSLTDLVAVLDPDGRPLYSSPSYRDLLGDAGKLHESSFFEQVHPDDRARVKQSFRETVRTGEGQRLECRLVDPRGQDRHIESQGSVIDDERGQVAKVVVVSRDVTERKRAEAALRALNQNLESEVVSRTAELQAALVSARSADRLKSAFLATMSHEVRTPLNSIIGFTGLVLLELPGPLNEEQKKQLGMAQNSARHLLALINDVLDISKIEAGELTVAAEPFDLAASIAKVAAIVGPLAEQKGLILSVTVADGVGAMIGDERRVEQILLNLLSNAIKFTKSGSVALAAAPVTDFQPETSAAPLPAVRLSVSDTGIGIKPEDMALLFTPFRQVDSEISRNHEGTGLGLAICRRLADLMGGIISAESRWREGSVFTATLPLHPPATRRSS